MITPKYWARRGVLLTGHTGFEGSWLALWLSELGAQVTEVGLEPDTDQQLFEQLQLERRLQHHHLADIKDPEGLAEITASCEPEDVPQVASQPLVRRSYPDPFETCATNVQGSLNLLEALKPVHQPLAVVIVTADKVYPNQKWDYGYREDSRLGGADPYSASKEPAELAIAVARAGNVIDGGDWAEDRIVPNTMRALAEGRPIGVRNPLATRPWQHVLEPLGGYLRLAEQLAGAADPAFLATAFNFGPQLEANRSVRELVEESLRHWPGRWEDQSDPSSPHEANLLNLVIDRAHHQLGWAPRWPFATTIERTVRWYRQVHEAGAGALACCQDDLTHYLNSLPS